MGWRFRRSIKVLPGIRLNVGKSGFTSVSVGRSGVHLNVGKRGVTRTLGIPGTGLSFQSHVPAGRMRSAAMPPPNVAPVAPTELALDRFGVAPPCLKDGAGRIKWFALALGVASLWLGESGLVSSSALAEAGSVVVGLLGLFLSVFLPSRSTLLARATADAQRQAQAELARRVEDFKTAAAAITDADSIRKVLALKDALGLTDQEAGFSRLETLRGALELREVEEDVMASGGKLTALEGHSAVVGDNACYFVAESVTFDRRGDNDPSGTLYLTESSVLFVSDGLRSDTPWSKVSAVKSNLRELQIQRTDRQTPYAFRLTTLGAALRAAWIGKTLRTSQEPTPDVASRVIRRPPKTPKLSELPISDDPKVFDCGSGQGCTFGIVGESYRQAALRAIDGGRRRLGENVVFVARVEREPENPYDANAVKVSAMDGAHLGYFPREDAADYQTALKAIQEIGKQACCRARLIGGTEDKPSIGVLLDLRPPNDLLNAAVPSAF